MNNTLFAMHNIKYIVSVDDCYFAPKREEIEGNLYAEMQTSIEPFRERLIGMGKSATVEEFDTLVSSRIDTDSFLRDVISTLKDSELSNLCSITEEIHAQDEKTGIIAFLTALKDQGCIEKYYTCSSTMDAMSLDCNAVGLTNGNILWLLDRNFERAGESPDAGIQLAQNIVQRKNEHKNYVYILSAVAQEQDSDEDSIEEEFDSLLSTKCNPMDASFIYYIHKQRILGNKESQIEKSLAQGFKRKVCFEIFQIYVDCLNESISASSKNMFSIRQQTLNYLFTKQISKKGESHKDFITRLVQILQADEYQRLLSEKYDGITEKIAYYEELCNTVVDIPADEKKITPILSSFRELELYDKYVNSQHLEISTGDIFSINGAYFLLVSQACDTYLRKDGQRKLQSACLLKIDQKGSTPFKYDLSCFMAISNPAILYQSQMIVPFDVLDLCVFQNDGQAQLKLAVINNTKTPQFVGYTSNFVARYKSVCTHISSIYNSRNTLEQYLDKDPLVTHEDAKSAYEKMLAEDSFLKKYTIQDDALCYQVKRIFRLNELRTIDIVKEYGIMLSRIGHPFDFTS